MFFKKYKNYIYFTFIWLFVALFTGILLFSPYYVSAAEQELSFKDSVANVIQIDWSDSSDRQVQHQVVQGSDVGMVYSNRRTKLYNMPLMKADLSKGAIKTSSFALHTAWGNYDNVFFSIGPEFGGTYFKFRIDLTYIYLSYMEEAEQYDVSQYFEKLSFYTSFMKAQLFINSNGDYITGVPKILGYYTGDISLGNDYSIEYSFKIPEGGCSINGFNFTFNHNIKNTSGMLSLDNVWLKTYFALSDFRVSDTYTNLTFDFSYLEDYEEKYNLLMADFGEKINLTPIDFLNYDNIFDLSTEQQNSALGLKYFIDDITTRLPFLNTLIMVSVYVGAFAFLYGLTVSAVKFFSD